MADAADLDDSAPPQAQPGDFHALAETLAAAYPALTAASSAFIARLEAAKAGAHAPKPGAAFPSFLLPDIGGRLVSLGDLCGAGPIVISFLRGHWCPFCQAEAEQLSRLAEALDAAGARLAIITPERAAFAAQIPRASDETLVLCDMDNGFASTLGLLVVMDDAIARAMLDLGLDLPAFQGGGGWTAPIPATFVLDGAGVIVARHIDPNYRVRMGAEALVTAVAAAAQARQSR